MNNQKNIVIGIIAIFILILTGVGYNFYFTDNIVTQTSKSNEIEIDNSANLYNNNLEGKSRNINLEDELESTETKNNSVYVYISGEVVNPGVYEIEEGERITTLVDIAGGFTENAFTVNINMAQKLSDEDHIHIENINNINEDDIVIASYDNKKSSDKGLVNINTATLEELKVLPSVGDVTAQNIIDYRERNGKFNDIDDLKNVTRIGTKTFEKLKDLISV